jgi:hypothetical protein
LNSRRVPSVSGHRFDASQACQDTVSTRPRRVDASQACPDTVSTRPKRVRTPFRRVPSVSTHSKRVQTPFRRVPSVSRLRFDASKALQPESFQVRPCLSVSIRIFPCLPRSTRVFPGQPEEFRLGARQSQAQRDKAGAILIFDSSRHHRDTRNASGIAIRTRRRRVAPSTRREHHPP